MHIFRNKKPATAQHANWLNQLIQNCSLENFPLHFSNITAGHWQKLILARLNTGKYPFDIIGQGKLATSKLTTVKVTTDKVATKIGHRKTGHMKTGHRQTCAW